MSEPTVQTLLAGQIDDADLRRLAELHFACFDAKGRTIEAYIEQRLIGWRDGDASIPGGERHIIREGDRFVANANSFFRTIQTPIGPTDVIALSSVAAHPDVRGRGLGRLVVRAAFDRVDQGQGAVSLFQTDAAQGFYEKLNCRVIDNPFFNSLDASDPQASPFWDRVCMIYPAEADWPEGPIDLRGPGY